MEMKEFKRYDWEEYVNKILLKLDYSQEQIDEIKDIRENWEVMTTEQFRFLFLAGIIKRTVKLKKTRTLYTDGDTVLYLNHHNKRFEQVGYFIEE